MTVQIRDYREEDREALYRMWSIAFAGGRPIPDDEPLLKDDDTVLVAEAGGGIAGGLIVHDMTATRGDAVLRNGGIGAVAVAPEHRHSGVGRALMIESLRQMRADGFHLSSLYAFRESYYRRFGWECAGRRYRITCPNQRFPRLACTLPVRQLTVDDWPALEPAYTPFARRYSGMNVRKGLRWARAVFTVVRSVDIPVSIYAVGDPVEAYAILRLAPEFWAEQDVLELVWSTPAGYQSILATLTALGINKSALKWHEPPDGPFATAWLDQGVKLEVLPPIMFRAVNVPEALAAIKPPADASGEFSLAVHDEHLPANRGPWRLSYREGRVQVEECGSADMETDVRHFTQALLGQPSFGDLVAQGFVSVHNGASVPAAAQLLPPRPTFCLDFF